MNRLLGISFLVCLLQACGLAALPFVAVAFGTFAWLARP